MAHVDCLGCWCSSTRLMKQAKGCRQHATRTASRQGSTNTSDVTGGGRGGGAVSSMPVAGVVAAARTAAAMAAVDLAAHNVNFVARVAAAAAAATIALALLCGEISYPRKGACSRVRPCSTAPARASCELANAMCAEDPRSCCRCCQRRRLYGCTAVALAASSAAA